MHDRRSEWWTAFLDCQADGLATRRIKQTGIVPERRNDATEELFLAEDWAGCYSIIPSAAVTDDQSARAL